MYISLLTATGNYNLGDELILLEEYKIFKEKFPQARFNIFTYDKKSSLIQDSVNYISYFPSNIRRNILGNFKYLWQNIITIYNSDLIIIGGGGLIYDTEIQKSLFSIAQWKFRIFLAKIFKKDVIYFALGINIKEKNYKKIKYLFTGKNIKVSVRDKKSQEILDKIGVKSTLVYDPVLLLEGRKKLKTTKEKYIGISLRKGYLKNEMENIKQMILYFTRSGYKIIFLSHSLHKKDLQTNDYKFLLELSRKYKCSVTDSLGQTLDVYKKLDFVIGMRLHSLILAIVNSIPFIAISYSQKTDELLKMFSYKYFLDARNFKFEELNNLFTELKTNKNTIKFDLNKKGNRIKKQLLINIINFLNYGLVKN